jgi:diadenosine tetraphosphate (Ap4A) HIT family hydrolase
MADGCVFCAIAQGSTPASIVCENDLALQWAVLFQIKT